MAVLAPLSGEVPEEKPPAKRARHGVSPSEADADSPAAVPAGDVGNGAAAANAAANVPSKQPAAPPPYAAGGYVAAGDGWWAHTKGEWLYNVEEKTYFHLPSGELRIAVDDSAEPVVMAATEAAADAPAGASSSSLPPSEGPVLRGRVKWFNMRKGYGFIEGSEAQEVFAHKNQLGEAVELRSLKPGVEVTYSLGETDEGRQCAVHIELASNGGADAAAAPPSKSGSAQKDAAKNAEEGAVHDAEEGREEEEEEDADTSSGSSVDVDLLEELHSGAHQVKGEAKDQCEDFVVDKTVIPISVLGETATCVFFAVFDGHGGGSCAEYASTHLAKNVLARLRDRTKTANDEMALRTALLGGFKQTEHNFLQHARRSGDSSGSTACTMTVFGPDEAMRLRLFLANAGDSRAVLGKASGGVVRLTEDHKPNLPLERKRIELEGGSVAEIEGVWRAILPQKRRQSGVYALAVSRSLGDKDFKGPNIISPDPDITIHEVDWDDDECVILATDGVWDVITDENAVRLVQRSLGQFGNERKAAEDLVQKARERGSKDDCSALVVRFGWLKVQKRGDEPDDDEGSEHAGDKSGDAVDRPSSQEQEGEGSKDGQRGEPGGRGLAAGDAPGAADGAEEDEEEDIFAAVPSGQMVDSTVPKEDDVHQPKDLAADGSGLFDGLTPTREELAVVSGPALPPGPAA